jgi:hypothetical protein
MPLENVQFDELSKELMQVVLTLTSAQDQKSGYAQSPVQRARQLNVVILESALDALKLLLME